MHYLMAIFNQWVVTFGVISFSAKSRILLSAGISVSAETEITIYI